LLTHESYALLFLQAFPRYNQFAVNSRFYSRLLFATILAIFSFWAASCAVPLGPGYTIERQQVRVRFASAPEPRIRIEADYQLKNTGTRPLSGLEMRLPGRRRFRYEQPSAIWGDAALTPEASPDNPRDTRVKFREPWRVSSRQTLRLSVEYLPANPGETNLSFSKDAFFLPAAGWSPELLPAKGIFATGGVPPKVWELLVVVPEGFQIHTSGIQKKTERKNGELTLLAEQHASDPYPFIVAGQYNSAEIGRGNEKMHLWTRQPQEAGGLREASDGLARVTAAYDASFGERGKESSQTWIVECPVAAGCLTKLNPVTAKLLGEEDERTTAEMISGDTIMVDLSASAPKLAAAAAPSLASSWLGYAQNPGFFEQELPLALLPAFAASLGGDAAEGGDARRETIRNALRLIPTDGKPHQSEAPAVLRAKSFLFFYGLQDRYGQEAFRKAIQYMLYARRKRGFELDDLIAAFEQETHQNVAEFVRQWMKRPGVPEEFRARYEGTAAADDHKETRP
jgi:hypothetical protein